LSGWPSETDSDVKRKSFDTLKLQSGCKRVAGLAVLEERRTL